jgi:NarL family two-component system response regulator LiaR
MSEQNCIRVMIVDDHAVVRSGLRFFMLTFDDIELVAEADSGEEALRLCDKSQPDVILMDMVMPGMDGATATQAIRERYPHVQVIALTSFKEEDLVQRALQAGAISYLLKDTSDEKLGEAIRSAYAGHPTLAPEAAEALVHAATHPHKLGHDLTEREREVLGLMVEGLNNVDIAERLVISRATAKFHVSNILSKLNVTNRAEAIVLAVQHKLVT